MVLNLRPVRWKKYHEVERRVNTRKCLASWKHPSTEKKCVNKIHINQSPCVLYKMHLFYSRLRVLKRKWQHDKDVDFFVQVCLVGGTWIWRSCISVGLSSVVAEIRVLKRVNNVESPSELFCVVPGPIREQVYPLSLFAHQPDKCCATAVILKRRESNWGKIFPHLFPFMSLWSLFQKKNYNYGTCEGGGSGARMCNRCPYSTRAH